MKEKEENRKEKNEKIFGISFLFVFSGCLPCLDSVLGLYYFFPSLFSFPFFSLSFFVFSFVLFRLLFGSENSSFFKGHLSQEKNESPKALKRNKSSGKFSRSPTIAALASEAGEGSSPREGNSKPELIETRRIQKKTSHGYIPTSYAPVDTSRIQRYNSDLGPSRSASSLDKKKNKRSSKKKKKKGRK